MNKRFTSVVRRRYTRGYDGTMHVMYDAILHDHWEHTIEVVATNPLWEHARVYGQRAVAMARERYLVDEQASQVAVEQWLAAGR